MKKLIVASIILFSNYIALASQRSVINFNCTEGERGQDCIEKKNVLLHLERLPELPDNLPIKLKVIPYLNKNN